MRSAISAGVAATLLAGASLASAGVVTFQSGVGNCAAMSSGETFTTQCAGDGVIGGANDFYYVDGRDTFDHQGISSNTGTGQLFFTSPVSNLSIDYLLLGGFAGEFDVFDSLHHLLTTFTDTPVSLSNVNGSHDFGSLSGIAELDFFAAAGGVSTLRFTASPVPEPGTFALLSLGLAGLAASRRRKQHPASG